MSLLRRLGRRADHVAHVGDAERLPDEADQTLSGEAIGCPSRKPDSRGITVTYGSAARAIERPGRAAAWA